MPCDQAANWNRECSVAIKLRYRTIFISDVHLGSTGCRARDLVAFLKRVECDTLYLVGDILDMWRLKQRWHWPTDHNRVISRMMKMAKKGTRVIYIPGNHDEHARQYTSLSFGGIELAENFIHTTADGRQLLVTHGDQFDMVVKHARVLSMLGGWSYDMLVTFNNRINQVRRVLGLRHWSLAKYVKSRVKKACEHISNFEAALADEAKRQGHHGVVCGHIHHAEIGTRAGVAYYNCGDWVESCTALVEHDDGTMQLLDGLAYVEALRDQARHMKKALRDSRPAKVAHSRRLAGTPELAAFADQPVA
jgi:UDP-2,3-diacylglucosamine pyrophosphatase LpxH